MATQLDTAKAYLGAKTEAVTEAQTPTAALIAIGELEDACRKARERVVVGLVLDDGWSLADVGRALGVTRQAVSKGYSDTIHREIRRRVRSAR